MDCQHREKGRKCYLQTQLRYQMSFMILRRVKSSLSLKSGGDLESQDKRMPQICFTKSREIIRLKKGVN